MAEVKNKIKPSDMFTDEMLETIEKLKPIFLLEKFMAHIADIHYYDVESFNASDCIVKFSKSEIELLTELDKGIRQKL